MTRRRRRAFALIVAVQALLLLALIGVNELALATGDEVTLRTVPVDPVDFFRGQYVTLRCDISGVQVPAESVHVGDVVYVPLHEEGDYWSGSFGFPEPPPDGRFIRGTVRYTDADGDSADVEYGIETYYADADEARELGVAGPLSVTVVLGDDGRARISRVEPVS
jgi:uncharacterized membrane-anchored protein